MKRFSKEWFSQIMIHKAIKHELDELKEIVRAHTGASHRISYADVIVFLIREYKKSLRIVYPISQKTLVGTKIKRGNLIVTPLRSNSTNVVSKLDGETRVVFSLEG